MLLSFLIFLLAFAAIGIASFKFSRKNQADYYLASQSVQPWLVGLSAVATNNSGYMFIGVIGYTYTAGFDAVWLMLGWLLGDFVGSMFIHNKLRQATSDTGHHSFGSVLSHWQGKPMLYLQRLLGIVAFVFLVSYASAQLVAGSKALSVLLGWPIYAGAIVGFVIVLAYCLAGGIRASIWTDAAQSFVMVFAMSLLLLVSVNEIGGVSLAFQKLQAIPGYLNTMPNDTLLPGLSGLLVFVIGWMFAGFSVIGQPHVMVRFMALENANTMVRARVWYYAWFTIFYFMATSVGMLAKLLLPESEFDAELALPTLALQTLPPMLVGLILAGIFAATMSTADSLVLSCSSIITNDVFNKKNSLWLAKGSTLIVASGALVWALVNTQSVFNLVVMSWSTLAAAFAPILILLAVGQRFSQTVAIILVVVGVAVSLGWRWLDWHAALYEGMPAIVIALLVFVVFRFLNIHHWDIASGRR